MALATTARAITSIATAELPKYLTREQVGELPPITNWLGRIFDIKAGRPRDALTTNEVQLQLLHCAVVEKDPCPLHPLHAFVI